MGRLQAVTKSMIIKDLWKLAFKFPDVEKVNLLVTYIRTIITVGT